MNQTTQKPTGMSYSLSEKRLEQLVEKGNTVIVVDVGKSHAKYLGRQGQLTNLEVFAENASFPREIIAAAGAGQAFYTDDYIKMLDGLKATISSKKRNPLIVNLKSIQEVK